MNIDLRIWVWISQDFDFLEILRRIVTEIEGQDCNLKSLQGLNTKVRAGIKEKRFLLVLDDAWNVDSKRWEKVLEPLRGGCNGSCSVIVTTRNLEVANSIEGRMDPIKLEGLDNECIWRVLECCAFGGPADPNKHLDLVKIGKDITKKLNGSPLAARAMGMVLKKGLSIDRWKGILQSELWHADCKDEYGNTILPSLMLSYQNLSPDLRQCFRLFSLFPKGCLFTLKENSIYGHDGLTLRHMWMAHGIFDGRADRSLEDCARDVFDALLSMSLLQEDEDGVISMHDLIHDVSEYVARGDHLRITIDRIIAPNNRSPSEVRHLSISNFLCEDEQNPDSNFANVPYEKLRTLLIRHEWRSISLDVTNLKKPTYLRVLDLSNCRIDKLLDYIPNLKHLRYLNLSSTGVSEFPKSFTLLYNLQILVLRGTKLSKLPDSSGNLINLRYVDLSNTNFSQLSKISRECENTSKMIIPELLESLTLLVNLQFLNLCDCRHLRRLPDSIGKCKNLRHLDLGSTDISELPESVTLMCDLQFLNLRYCRNLTRLTDSISKLTNLRHLDLNDTYIFKLPESVTSLVNLNIVGAHSDLIGKLKGFGTMTCLQNLGEFSVGRTDGRGVEQLEKLDKLEGELIIRCLENVKGEEEARKARLQQKVRLKRLRLEWTKNATVDSQVAEGVLEALQPSGDRLQYLAIRGYKGKVFPGWLTDGSRYPNLTHIELEDWESCGEAEIKWPLPLSVLVIDGFRLCSNLVSQNILACLKELYIAGCGVEDETVQTITCRATSLRELWLTDCPRLCEPVEKELVIGCQLQRSLDQLRLGGGNWGFLFHLSRWRGSWKLYINQLEDSSSSEEGCSTSSARRWAWDLLLGTASQVHHLGITRCGIKSMGMFKDLFLVTTSLRRLSIKECKQLLSLPIDFLAALPSLDTLSIKQCNSLELGPSDFSELTSLKKLKLKRCGKVESMAEVGLPVSLEELEIRWFEDLTSLPANIKELTSLKKLELERCGKVESMADVGLPVSLEELRIKEFWNLTSLPANIKELTSLKRMVLSQCPKLASFPTSGLPDSLPYLMIWQCEELEKRYKRERGGPDWEFLSNVSRVWW